MHGTFRKLFCRNNVLTASGRWQIGERHLAPSLPISCGNDGKFTLKCANPKHGSGKQGCVLLMLFTDFEEFLECSIGIALEKQLNRASKRSTKENPSYLLKTKTNK